MQIFGDVDLQEFSQNRTDGDIFKYACEFPLYTTHHKTEYPLS